MYSYRRVLDAFYKTVEEKQDRMLILFFNQKTKTHRWTNPHVRIHVLTIQNLARTPRLFRTVHVLEAAMVLGERVRRAILAARLIRIHVHLVLDVSLQQPGDRFVRLTLHMLVRIAAPHLPIGVLHYLAQQFLGLARPFLERFAHQLGFAREIAAAVRLEQHPGELDHRVAFQFGQRNGRV